MPEILRLRFDLTQTPAPPVWPQGFTQAPLDDVDPCDLHAILATAYENGFGSVPDFHTWWTQLTTDSEFDPALVFVAVDSTGRPAGLCQCWTSAFIKDIAVHSQYRGRGLGQALLQSALSAFSSRGASHVDLKVDAANHTALALYRRAGMVAARL